MNYFEFYQLPIAFKIDAKKLKRKFYEYSRKYHPDFFVQASASEQEDVLEKATINNKAFKTLSNLNSRIKYVLECKGIIEEGEKYQLPPMFLMEMMEVNEALMDLQFEADAANLKQITQQVNRIEADLFESVSYIIENYKDGVSDESDLKKVKDFYFKKRYLLRIRESLNKFAAD
ncbi:MAG: Fe-S protein assembly co-chaperone HscB [Chitinophagales bacterium]